jgi:hypothetical protein
MTREWNTRMSDTGSMGRLLRRFPYTSVSFALVLVVLAAAVLWDIDVFSLPGVAALGIDQGETDEIALACLLVVPAFFIDSMVSRQRAHEAQLQAEQLRVLRLTMRTVQDIVNNNLNQLQLLRLEAESHVSEATLTLFDHALQDTATKLRTLGNMAVFAEKPMAGGPGLDVGVSSSVSR